METFDSFTRGYAPEVKQGQGNPEALKYGRLWQMPQYRAVAPGESLASVFLQVAQPRRGSDVIDFGCGTGRGALVLALVGGCRVTMVDFVRNSLDPEMQEALTTQSHVLRFVKHDLEKPLPFAAEYGFCTDVMEHIPPDKVDIVLDNILHAAQHCFFSIATQEDNCGQLIGEDLHLTVEPFEWWEQKFKDRDCIFHWSQNEQGAALFYVTAWQTGHEIVSAGELNIGLEKVRENVKHNTAQDWRQVSPQESRDVEVLILGGGPSLNDYANEIRERHEAGAHIVTLNGAYNWALNHGFERLTQIVVDARPFNARFTKPVMPKCKYLIASQCNPLVLEDLPKDRTWLWHTSAESIRDILDNAYQQWWYIPGGSTVLLRAIPLLRLLGYSKFILYGVDSCIVGETHHAYAQPENDSDNALPVKVTGGRMFKCYPWMIAQASEFMDLIKFLGEQIELEIPGDGLLAHILNTGARLADEENAKYRCGECGEIFEDEHATGVGTMAPAECPRCGEENNITNEVAS